MTSARAELQHMLTFVPPGVVQHHNATAHAALEALRNSGDPTFLFVRTMLELVVQQQQHSSYQQQRDNDDIDEELLLFHCLTGCRHVSLTGWTKQYSSTFLRVLRDYCMVLGHQLLMNASRANSLACYAVAASFWKRGWNHDDDDENNKHRLEDNTFLSTSLEQALIEQMAVQAPVLYSKKDLFLYLQSMFQQEQDIQNLSQQRAAATFIGCLVGEFGAKSLAVNYRMGLEFHKAAHRSFEKDALQQCLQLAMHALSAVVGSILVADHPSSSMKNDTPAVLSALVAIVQLLLDIVGWEFGLSPWSSCSTAAVARATSFTLLRPPIEWRDYLVRPDLARAIFQVHHHLLASSSSGTAPASNTRQVVHILRQLLLALASMSGPMFTLQSEREAYAAILTEGTYELLKNFCSGTALYDKSPGDDSCLLDSVQLVSRLVGNFRLSTLVTLPSFVPLLQGLAAVGQQLLMDQVSDCERAAGDIDSMEHREWREDVLVLILEAAVLLCGDPWLLYSGTEASRKDAQIQLSAVLGPLYEGFVRSRTRISALEEHFLVRHEAELDEVRERITETETEEELVSVAALGRLNLSAALACLSNLFTCTMPQLEVLWQGNGDITPDSAALLEQSRLLTLHVMHLLTDNNDGEAPSIPDGIVIACRENPGLASEIASTVQALFKFANAPVYMGLSPLLASSFLMFLHRWAPAYIYPVDSGDYGSNPILLEWSTPEQGQQAVSFCVSICLHYQCYWPKERRIQEIAGHLLLSLARRGGRLRSFMVKSPEFQLMVQFHCLTTGIQQCGSRDEFDTQLRSKGGDAAAMTSDARVWGYQRLPYDDRRRILTSILVGCSDKTDVMANQMINESLKAIHDALSRLIHDLSSRQLSFHEIQVKDVACLCVEMLIGVTHASEMADPERIPQLLTGYLPQLSGLMNLFATDLTICELLLRFFRDYTEYFIATLDREQSLALFNTSAELLKSYSAHHCASRSIAKLSTTEADAVEDQAYNDILIAIQLLINLGTKDFVDACSTERGVDSSQVTSMIFFGLQQILPLMTQGLLQYPSLYSVFFELIAFMTDTYPEIVCVLPFDLFNSLLESLLFGMSHHSPNVAISSLYGLASVAREQIKSRTLKPHLDVYPDILDKCSRRLLAEVVFQQVIVDRVEAAGMALLPLMAVDVNRFAAVVQELTNQVQDTKQRNRLQGCFANLVQPDVLVKVLAAGYEGRQNRIQFKKKFELFIEETQSFLVLR
jgi:hypothetical protein